MIIPQGTALLCLILAWTSSTGTLAFSRDILVSNQNRVRPIRPRLFRSAPTFLADSKVSGEDIEQEETEEQATLVLKGEYSTQSPAAPVSSPDEMMTFFEVLEHRKCLVSAGHKLDVELIDSTIGLQEKWIAQALRFGATEPEIGDIILSVRTGGLSLPGLTISTTATIGTKVVPPSDTSIYPSVEFVTLEDKTEASGFRPVVWIFNQLTGADKNKTGERTFASSVSRFTVQPGDSEDEIKFDIRANLIIQINFPAFLLRIMPVSKEKAEQQGGDAIVKALSRDIDRSMAAFHEVYCASDNSR